MSWKGTPSFKAALRLSGLQPYKLLSLRNFVIFLRKYK